MKNLLKYSGILAAVMAIVGFILMLTTNALIKPIENSDPSLISGTAALFGSSSTEGGVLITGTIHGAATGVIAFILAIVAILAAAVAAVADLLKVKPLAGIAGILNLVAAGALLVAGILVFTIPAGVTAEVSSSLIGATSGAKALEGYGLDVGYVFVAILYFVGAALAALPAVMKLLKK